MSSAERTTYVHEDTLINPLAPELPFKF